MRALAIIALCGCGPNLHALAEHRHYREAICAARDGSSGDRDEIGAALDADAGLVVHVQAVSPTQLAALLGNDAAPIAERARFVRVEVQTSSLPVDGLTLGTELDDGATPIASRVNWESLARITGETLPPKTRDTTYLTNGNVVRGLGAFLTLGLAPLATAVMGSSYFKPGVVEVDAPDAEYKERAPRAHTLYHAMEDRDCTHTGPLSRDATGARCTWFFAMDRDVRAAAELKVIVRYSATRADDHDPPCIVERVRRISLGHAADLDTTVEQMFGSQMRTLDEIHAIVE
jgi:hypothetical protein